MTRIRGEDTDFEMVFRPEILQHGRGFRGHILVPGAGRVDAGEGEGAAS